MIRKQIIKSGWFWASLLAITFSVIVFTLDQFKPAAAHRVPTAHYWNMPGPLPANMEHREIQSSYLVAPNDLVGINVYKPPGYETPGNTQRYPVIYLLHGINGDERNYFSWFGDENNVYTDTTAISLIEGSISHTLAVPQALVVLVNGGKQSFYNDFTDQYHGPTSPFPILSESIIMNEVIPYVDANFRTVASRQGRAIEGFSMGGRGALKFAFKYPHKFCSVVAYAGAPYEAVPYNTNPYYGPFPLEDRMSTIVNTYKAAILNNDLWIRLVVGELDLGMHIDNDNLDDLLTNNNIPHEYEGRLSGVGHNWGNYYRSSGEIGLNFHLRCFQNAAGMTDTFNYLPVIIRSAAASPKPSADPVSPAPENGPAETDKSHKSPCSQYRP